MSNENFDVVVVGGGPAGIISAVTARKYYPDKKILLIKNTEIGVVPCGIPYMFKTLFKPEDNIMGDAPLQKNNVSIMVDEVVAIDRKVKTIKTKKGQELTYEKLILATGSNPILPPIKGIDQPNVYPIVKELGYLKQLKERVLKAKNVLIIGGGFIGVEFADELAGIAGLTVHLVEFLPHLLQNSSLSGIQKKKMLFSL